MNRLLNFEEKQVVILGIGTNAKILKKIYEKRKVKIVAFILSDDQNIVLNNYEGIPVYKMCECDDIIKNELVICSVRECVLCKVKEELDKSGFKRFLFVEDYKEWVYLLEYFYRGYFEEKDIDITRSLINICGSFFTNPFQLDIEGKYSYLAELGDIILPSYFNDYIICNEGPYELREIGLEVKKGDVVFDCGANMGLFSVLSVNKGGEVFAFEPAPHTRDYLKQYLEIYSGHLEIFSSALSNEEGKTNFYVGSSMNGENSISNLSGTGKECIIVPTTTIDNFVKQKSIDKVDFIKADIEGAERYMLLGAKDTMRKFAPKLAICTYHLKDDPKILTDIIKKANPNYKIVHKYKKLYAYVEK